MTHQEFKKDQKNGNIVHLKLQELNCEGHNIGGVIRLILDQQASTQWTNNSILRLSSSKVYELLVLFQSKFLF